MADRTDRVGQRFGDYWLRRRLGGGGFGDVYLGEHAQTKSLAAVKVLHIRLTRGEDLRAFLNEVRTFRLQHPHIVRVLDVGIASDETPFLVMAYAPHGTLRDRHPKGTRLLLSTVLAYVVPLASALQYAHDLHVVHRDVKPENMLLGAGEVLWLSDFGIATVAHSTGSLTTEGMGGTLLYMAPEQIQGRPRPQSDQYALAIVVYEWLTGTWPFRGTPIEIAMQQQMTPPPALRTQVPTLPLEVEQVVLTALSKNPKERFGTIQAFATALEQAARPPLEQSASPERPQQALSTTEHLQSRPTVKATESEWQQAGASPLTGPHITDAVPAPSTENVVSESPPGSFPAPSVSVPSSATPSPPLPDTLSHPPTEPSPTSGVIWSDVPMQAAAIAPPSPAPRQTQRRPSSAVTVVLILLALILLGGVSFAIYHGMTGSPSGTSNTPGTSNTLYSVAWSGTQFVAVGNAGTILASPDGRTWTTQTSGTSSILVSVAWSGSGFVAVGGAILTSPDGHTWTAQTSGTSLDLSDVVWSGSQFVAVGLGGTILTSPDGHTWTQGTGTFYTLTGIAWSGTQFVAVGNGVYTSPDRRTWTRQDTGIYINLNGVAWSGTQFVAVGNAGTILTSPDGRTWTAQTSGTSKNLYSVVRSGSGFVAVGDAGTILTSLNGRTWTAQTSGTSKKLYGVVRSGSGFVVVGDAGTILTSLDGRTWTAQTSGTPNWLRGVAWSGSQFVPVGDGATILTLP